MSFGKSAITARRRTQSDSPFGTKMKMRPVSPKVVGAMRGSTAPNALEKMCRRTLRIQRQRRLPTANRGQSDRHFANHGRHGDHWCLRLLGTFHRKCRTTLRAELANRASRHPSGYRSLLDLPPLATPPRAAAALTAGMLATTCLGRGGSSRGGPRGSDHSAAPRGRQNDPQSRDKCQNSTQPKHRCSIFQIARPHKREFRSRSATAFVPLDAQEQSIRRRLC